MSFSSGRLSAYLNTYPFVCSLFPLQTAGICFQLLPIFSANAAPLEVSNSPKNSFWRLKARIFLAAVFSANLCRLGESTFSSSRYTAIRRNDATIFVNWRDPRWSWHRWGGSDADAGKIFTVTSYSESYCDNFIKSATFFCMIEIYAYSGI